MSDKIIPPTKDFRLLLLGGGPVVRHLHLPAIQTLGWTEHSVAVDLSLSGLEHLKNAAPALRIRHDDFRKVLSDPDFCQGFDAALISLPNGLHALAVEGALKAGLPVLCEKPLAMSVAECQQLLHVSAELKRPLFVAMVMRHLPGLKAMRQAIAEGLIGEIQSVDIEDGSPFSWDAEAGGYFKKQNGGVLLNMGVHFIDLLEWLFGPMSCVAYLDDAAGGVEANFEFCLQARDVPIRLEVSYTRALRNTFVVVGAEGKLVFDKSDPSQCTWFKGGVVGKFSLKRPFQHGNWKPTMLACYAEQLAAFAAQIKNGVFSTALAPAKHGLSAARLIDWAVGNRANLNDQVNKVDVSAETLKKIKGRIAITGGTGFVGSRLLGALSQCSDTEVVSVVRKFRNGAAAGRFNVNTVRADLLNFEEMCKAFRGARYAFHLAYGSDGDDAQKVTVDGALTACRAAVHEGVESIIVVGTTAVYGPQPDGVIVNEQYPMRRKGSAYERAKAIMVREVLRYAETPEAANTRITIVEPACVYGPGGKPFTELPVQLADSGQFAWIEDGKGVANVVYVDSLVEALILAATTAEARSEKIIVQDCAVTWREFLTPILGNRANSIPSVSVNDLKNQPRIGMKDVLKAAIRSPEVSKTLSEWPIATWGRRVLDHYARSMMTRLRKVKQSSVPQAIVTTDQEDGKRGTPPQWLSIAFGTESPKLTNEKARRLLKWTPLPLTEGQRRTIKWLEYARLASVDFPEA